MVRLECFGKGRGRRSSRAGCGTSREVVEGVWRAGDGWGSGRGKVGEKTRSQAESGFG